MFKPTGFLYFTIFSLVVMVSITVYQKYSSNVITKEIEEWANSNQIRVNKNQIKLSKFKIEFNENEWNNLVAKLNNTRYFDALNDIPSFEFGFNPEFAKELVDEWKTNFNWKEKVDELNKFDQYKIVINDVTIHFVRLITNKNAGRKPIPLMLIDGWPGSFYCFYKMLGYIKDNFKDVSFDIIVPSIPGYGYSMPLNKKIDAIDTAQLFDALMRHIHNTDDCQYFVHGQDWGSIVATTLAQLYPSRINGIHLSMPIASETLDLSHTLYSLASPIFPSLLFTQYEIEMNLTSRYNLNSRFKTILKEFGYMHLQATKPDTLGHALTDSPVGLLAYILEKYSTWSFKFNEISGQKDGNLNKFNKEDLLTIVTIYWMSNSITPSIRFYKSYFDLFGSTDLTRRNILDARLSSQVPVSVQYFENEIIIFPSSVIKIRYPNLKRYVIEKNGGHFSAFENPIAVSDDLLEFIKSTLISNNKQ